MDKSNRIIFISLVLLILIASSCSIQKRRYRPGYHISFNKNYSYSKSSRTVKESVDVRDSIPSKEEDTKTEQLTQVPEIDSVNTNFETEVVHYEENIEAPRKKDQNKTVLIDQNIPITSVIEHPVNLKPKRMKMKQNEKKQFQLSKRQIAIMIGISLLLMAVLAGLSVPPINNILVPGNTMQTGLNFAAQSNQFLGSIFGWIAITILDLLVSWGIYKYYKKDKPKLAATTGILRLIYSVFLGVAVVQLIQAYTTSSPIQIHHFLTSFNSIWGWGLIVFGLHLIALGLLYKNENGKKWLNILIKSFLIIAGIGYMTQYIGILLVANPVAFAAAVESIFIVFMILGEIGFAIWMLARGGKETN